ncbi:MAG: segregation/condensation protein A [Moorella humiferrea]|nr:segregation/condensation protein A [Moorella humiferrea]
MIGNVRLDVFQGPLDLLLTLIERREIDVQAISVAEVTSQYLEYLNEVTELDLDWASEFLVLGAELLALKARFLLRHPGDNELEEEEKDGSEEPGEVLVDRLLTYRRYREAACKLAEMAAKGGLVYGRPLDQDAVARTLAGINPLSGIGPADLSRAMTRLLAKVSTPSKPVVSTLTKPAFTLIGQIRVILRRLKKTETLTLGDFLSPQPTRLEAALTFLALLELARRGRVNIYQEEVFGTITVTAAKR